MLTLSWEALPPAMIEMGKEVASLLKVEQRPSCRGDRASKRLPPVQSSSLFFPFRSGRLGKKPQNGARESLKNSY